MEIILIFYLQLEMPMEISTDDNMYENPNCLGYYGEKLLSIYLLFIWSIIPSNKQSDVRTLPILIYSLFLKSLVLIVPTQ